MKIRVKHLGQAFSLQECPRELLTCSARYTLSGHIGKIFLSTKTHIVVINGSGGAVEEEMTKKHTIKQGECISSLACKYNLLLHTIWNHPANTDLKKQRENPNALFPGDVVVVPEQQLKSVSGETGIRHTFRRKGLLEHLCIQLQDEDGEPRRFLSYRIMLEGQIREGKTDEQGVLEERIPPNAEKGLLMIGQRADVEEYHLQIGHLDPITTVSGVQKRLNNLGWECGPEDGVLGPKTREAIARFQQHAGLTATGELDERMRQKLVEIHGS